METRLKRNKSILLVILTYMLFAFGGPGLEADKVNAAEQAVPLSMHSGNPEENIPFLLTNMFPGDSTTQYYRLSVSYTGTITVNFHAVATDDEEKLSEVLIIKVRWADTGELIYEGSLADMPVLGQELSTDSKSRTEELTYEVTVGLSTSVGNEYQNKKLIAELSWWAEGEETPEPSEPESGENPTEPSEPGSGENPTEPSESEVGEDPTEPGEPKIEDDQGVSSSTGGRLTDPSTGDENHIFMWIAVMFASIAAILLILARYRRGRLEMSAVTQSRRRLFFGIFLAAFLILGLGVTSVALVWQKVAVEENLFQTGNVSINLNDGQPILRKNMFFEPGMVIKEDFTLSNEDSTCDVYYRLYFTEVKGDLAEVLQVEVFDGDTTIFEGTLADMNGKKSEGADGILREGETRAMTIVFRVPEDCGNVMQGSTILFDLNADAVQTVNNPDGLFE